MTIIDKTKFAEYMAGVDWFEDIYCSNHYIFDEDGVRVANPLTNDDAKSVCLIASEVESIRGYENSIKLDLPCTPNQLKDWTERNGFDVLPENFADIHNDDISIIQYESASIENDTNPLLNEPKKRDGWFDAIFDMTLAFHGEHGKIPKEAQAWATLWSNPPAGYLITTGIDKGGEVCLIMADDTLSKTSFGRRWKKYTNNDQ
jgi:hypothetical protein